MTSISKNLNNLKLGKEIKLIVVTKSVPVDQIMVAIKNDVTDIGENYVQEAEEKYKKIGKRVKWHFIGHLQSNKVKRAVAIFDVIQTVHNFKLAKKINNAAKDLEKIQKVMIQVNITHDKEGVEPEEVSELYEKMSKLKHIGVIGLMTIAEKEKPSISFKKMKNLNSKLKLKYLSMGMSNDYEEAIKCGANMVRIGSKIFGPRKDSILKEPITEISNLVNKIFKD